MTEQQQQLLVSDFGAYLAEEGIANINDLDLEVIYGWDGNAFAAAMAETGLETASGFFGFLTNPVNQGLVQGVISGCTTVAQFAQESVEAFAGGIGGGPGQGGGQGGSGGGNS